MEGREEGRKGRQREGREQEKGDCELGINLISHIISVEIFLSFPPDRPLEERCLCLWQRWVTFPDTTGQNPGSTEGSLGTLAVQESLLCLWKFDWQSSFYVSPCLGLIAGALQELGPTGRQCIGDFILVT